MSKVSAPRPPPAAVRAACARAAAITSEAEGLKLKMKKRQENGQLQWRCSAAQDFVSRDKYLKWKRKYAQLLEDYKKLNCKYTCLEQESQWFAQKLEQGARFVVAAPAAAPPPASATSNRKHLGRGVFVTQAQWRALRQCATSRGFVGAAVEMLYGRETQLAGTVGDSGRSRRRPLDPDIICVIQGRPARAKGPESSTRASAGRYACAVCDKRFPTSNRLKVHARVHSGETPYHCSECPQRFTQQSHLNQHHARYHAGAGAPRRRCPLCARTFGQLAYVRWHLLRAHRGRARACVTAPLRNYKPVKPIDVI